MEILKKLSQNNFNEVAKLIQNNQIPEQLMTGNIKSQLRKYRHLYSTPASLSLAQKHQQAVKFCYKPSVKISNQDVCECCNVRVYNEEIGLCQKVQKQTIDPKNFMAEIKQYKLTLDTSLFFTFVKSCIFLTIINSLIHSAFNIYSSQFFGKHCENLSNCHNIFWNTLSMPNKYGEERSIMIVDILNLVAICLTIIFLSCNRRRYYRISSQIESQTQNQANYTIFVSNIPILEFPKKGQQIKKGDRLEFYHRKHLEEHFNNLITKWLQSKDTWQQNKDKIGLKLQQLTAKNNGELRSNEIVKSISLCYNLSRLQTLIQIKSELAQSFQNQQDEGTSLLLNEQGQPLYSQRFLSIPQRIGFLNDCQLVLNGQFARDNSFLFSVTHFVGSAFVTFQYQHYKEVIQRLYVQNPIALYYNGNYLKIQDACHPTDINWENMKVLQKQRRRKIFASYLTLGLVLLFSFVVMLFLQLWKQFNSQTQKGDLINIGKSYSLTAVIVIILLSVNYGLNSLAQMLTIAGKRKTRTNYLCSVLTKIFITKLINTIMLYFFIAILLRDKQLQTQFMGPIGLVTQISALIVISGVIHIIFSLIYPEQLFSRIKRWWKYRKYQQSVQNKFQITLNKDFQYPQFDFASKYSYYMVTLYAAFFYSYLVPIAVPVVCVLFFLQYWVDKYILFRRSSLKYQFGLSLSKYTFKILESSVFLLGLGNFIFSHYMHNYTFTLISWIGFGIGVLFTLLVWIAPKNIEKLIFGQQDYNQKYTYDDCLHAGKFETTYWTQNPATFLIEEEKVTGKRKAVNPALNRKSLEGDIFISAFHQ